jgi:hypothetical protein
MSKKKRSGIEQIPTKEVERTFTRADLRKCAIAFIDQNLGWSTHGADHSTEAEVHNAYEYEGIRTTLNIVGDGIKRTIPHVPVSRHGELVREGLNLIYHTWFPLGAKLAYYQVNGEWIIRFAVDADLVKWRGYLAFKGIVGREVDRPAPREQRVYKKKKGEKVLVTRPDNHHEF